MNAQRHVKCELARPYLCLISMLLMKTCGVAYPSVFCAGILYVFKRATFIEKKRESQFRSFGFGDAFKSGFAVDSILISTDCKPESHRAP